MPLVDINVPNDSTLIKKAVKDSESPIKPKSHRCIRIFASELLGYSLTSWTTDNYQVKETSLGVISGFTDDGFLLKDRNGRFLYNCSIFYEARSS